MITTRLFVEHLSAAAVLLAILLVNNIFLYKRKITDLISLMLISAICMTGFEILWSLVEGHAELGWALYISTGGYCVTLALFAVYLNRYLIDRFGLRPGRVWNIMAYRVPVAAVLLLCITTPWTHFMMSVDENAILHEMFLYATVFNWLIYAYIFSPLIIAVYFLTIGRKKRPAGGEIPPSLFVFGAMLPVLFWIQMLLIGEEDDGFSETAVPITIGLVYLITNVSTHTIIDTRTRVEAVETDLRIASKIQADALPPAAPEFADHPELCIRGCMNTAKEVGGDFYDYFPIDDDRICFLIADVSGKGTPAALFMMTAKTVIKDYALTRDSTAEIFTAVNKRLCENNAEGMFATAWIGILDTRTMMLQYTNAGHNYPILKRKGRPCELMETSHGLFLAGLDFTSYSQSSIRLEPGDRLLLYTDGATEAHDSSNKLYGTERLERMLENCGDLPDEQLLDSILEDLYAFAEGVPQFDDITMVVITMKDQAS